MEVSNFSVDVLERIDTTQDFLRKVSFSDYVTFHINGIPNRHNCRIW